MHQVSQGHMERGKIAHRHYRLETKEDNEITKHVFVRIFSSM